VHVVVPAAADAEVVSVSVPARIGVAASMRDARLATVFADPALLRLVFQPIVDLQRGVVAG
jgi:hypothetical protein